MCHLGYGSNGPPDVCFPLFCLSVVPLLFHGAFEQSSAHQWLEDNLCIVGLGSVFSAALSYFAQASLGSRPGGSSVHFQEMKGPPG